MNESKPIITSWSDPEMLDLVGARKGPTPTPAWNYLSVDDQILWNSKHSRCLKLPRNREPRNAVTQNHTFVQIQTLLYTSTTPSDGLQLVKIVECIHTAVVTL
jgi:hypothetical protein